VNIDDTRIRTTLQAIHPRLTLPEANAIIDVARLAAAADKASNVEETSMLLALTRVIAEMAGTSELTLVPSVDMDRLLEIGNYLVEMGPREVAFACAFLVMVQDLDVTKEERQLADQLGDALVLAPARAKQLAAEMEALVRTS
jgi:hypothetical protein